MNKRAVFNGHRDFLHGVFLSPMFNHQYHNIHRIRIKMSKASALSTIIPTNEPIDRRVKFASTLLKPCAHADPFDVSVLFGDDI